MTFKEIFRINDLTQMIKLDDSSSEFIIFDDNGIIKEVEKKENAVAVNEWNQEYELIYSSYVLER